VAESEVYRQLLKLELQTLKICTKRNRLRLTSVSTYLPAIISGLPFLKGLFGRKKQPSSGSPLKRMGSLLLLGWKTYQRFRPFLGPNKVRVEKGVAPETAAEEYLSRSL